MQSQTASDDLNLGAQPSRAALLNAVSEAKEAWQAAHYGDGSWQAELDAMRAHTAAQRALDDHDAASRRAA